MAWPKIDFCRIPNSFINFPAPTLYHGVGIVIIPPYGVNGRENRKRKWKINKKGTKNGCALPTVL